MKIAFVHNLKRNDCEFEAEFDTPEVVAAIIKGIADQGHEVIPVEMTLDGQWLDELLQHNCDLVFNTAEGFRGVGREAFAPVAFEQLKLPFVGSGSYSCFLTLDKFLTKQVVSRSGVRVIPGFFLSNLDELSKMQSKIEFPAFVKPNFEGSSKGITEKSICQNFQGLKSQAKKLLARFPEGLIVEQYIDGKDVTVPYVSGLGSSGVLDPVEYVLLGQRKNSVYDFELKNELDEQVKVKCPANISPELIEEAKQAMLKCVRSLGVADMARADFRIGKDETLYFMELNALPSLQPGAGIFAASSRLKLNYTQTLGAIVEAAQERLELKTRPLTRSDSKALKPKVALVYNLKRLDNHQGDYESEAEFDSPKTIESILQAIRQNGVEAIKIEANELLIPNLKRENIDIVFNIAEGQGPRSREAQVPAICDFLKIEHTGSDAACLSLALDKYLSCQIVATGDAKVPRSLLLSSEHIPEELPLDYPIIVKPNHEGTSKGIHKHSVAQSRKELKKLVTEVAQKYSSQILLQEYIIGRELTVGVLGTKEPKILKPLEIKFKKTAGPLPVYSFEHKQLDEQLDNEFLSMECPAKITDSQWSEIQKSTMIAFQTIGCRDVARVDFRLNEKGCYFIEINPLPGLSPGFSDLSIMAEKQRISYQKLIAGILDPAIPRWKHRKTLDG